MSFTELVRKNLKFAIIFPLVIAGLVLVGSLFQEEMYKSSVSLMVVQQQTEDINAQTSVKSAEQMADILGRVVDSAAFRSTVMADQEIRLNLPEQPWKQDKEWREIVKTKNITDTGILVIDVYQPSTAEATKLAGVVERNLIGRAYDYLGTNPEVVHITQLNPPAPTNDKPATPNLLLNAVVGWLFGLIAAFSLMLLFPNWFTREKKVKAAKPVVAKPASAPAVMPAPVEAPAFNYEPAGGMIFSNKFLNDFEHPMAMRHGLDTEQEDAAVAVAPSASSDDNKVSFVARAHDAYKMKF